MEAVQRGCQQGEMGRCSCESEQQKGYACENG